MVLTGSLDVSEPGESGIDLEGETPSLRVSIVPLEQVGLAHVFPLLDRLLDPLHLGQTGP